MFIKSKLLLIISSSVELATGLAVFCAPNLVASLLLSTTLTPGGEAVARVGGAGLISLGIACWPRRGDSNAHATRALFVYNLLAGSYLGYLKFTGQFNSFLLLPACALHVLLAILFVQPALQKSPGPAS
jgi:hypothetical protein